MRMAWNKPVYFMVWPRLSPSIGVLRGFYVSIFVRHTSMGLVMRHAIAFATIMSVNLVVKFVLTL